MVNNELYHHGILGMKWGVRRYQNKDGTLTATGKKKAQSEAKADTEEESKSEDKPKVTSSSKKSINELSDEELKSRISRLELEKRYSDLSKPAEQKKQSKGKAFVMDILEKSGKNIGTQLTTYAMGTAVNKMFGKDIVNPKKGQKDK